MRGQLSTHESDGSSFVEACLCLDDDRAAQKHS